MDWTFLLLIVVVLIAIQPFLRARMVAGARRRALERLSQEREATVITLIHRQETISLLGVPLMRHIDIDDSESVLRAIRETPSGRAIEIVLHTPGGLVARGAPDRRRARRSRWEGHCGRPALRDERRDADRTGCG